MSCSRAASSLICLNTALHSQPAPRRASRGNAAALGTPAQAGLNGSEGSMAFHTPKGICTRVKSRLAGAAYALKDGQHNGLWTFASQFDQFLRQGRRHDPALDIRRSSRHVCLRHRENGGGAGSKPRRLCRSGALTGNSGRVFLWSGALGGFGPPAPQGPPVFEPGVTRPPVSKLLVGSIERTPDHEPC
jgi:hypothetical protein